MNSSISTLSILSLVVTFFTFVSPVKGKQLSHSHSLALHEQQLLQKTVREKDSHLLVVFVHGTIIPVFSLSSVWATLQDFFVKSDREGDLYRRYTCHLRDKSFYKLQPIGPLGMHKVAPAKKGSVSERVCFLYQELSKLIYPEMQSCSSYTFGWSGNLSSASRKSAAHQLARSLRAVIAAKRAEIGSEEGLEVHVIGHSHGGNVLLNMASLPGSEESGLSIDKLILLGCPVQSETASYAYSSLFKKVYNFYSRGDILQVIDIVTTKDPISRRLFPFTHEQRAKKQVMQVELSAGKWEPRHVELWLWGGRNNPVYRKRFPLFPFPVVCFMPLLTTLLDEYAADSHHVGLSINSGSSHFSFALTSQEKDFVQKASLQACNFIVSVSDLPAYAWMTFM